MRSKISILCLLVLMVMLWQACETNEANSAQDETSFDLSSIPEKIDFSIHVKPILSDRCFVCHGPDKNAIEGNLSLHTAEGAYIALGENLDRFAIVPGDVESSELVHRIFSEDKGSIMPPPESNLVLSDEEKHILKRWIEQGAEYKRHWAFVRPEMPETPNPTIDWGNGDVDRFIQKKREEKNLGFAEPSSPEKLLRRIHFDLTGLPPTASQVETFSNDPSQYEAVIDSLLLTIDHAEFMASDWMDVARYADTHGYQDDFERTMWPWRDWVIHAFKENMPYDQFVTMQLAGDLMPDATLEHVLATGFNRNHKITAEGGVIPEEYRVEYVEDRLQTFGTAFLGLTVECARCHDHKYDPISQKNHFEMFSFFNNVPERGLIDNAADIPEPFIMVSEKEVEDILSFINFNDSKGKEIPVMVMDEMSSPRQAYVLGRGAYDQPTDKVYPNTPDAILAFDKELPQNRLGLAQWLFDEANPLTARVTANRLWQRFFGNGLVASSYDFGNQGSLPTHPELLDYLALKLIELEWDLNALTKEIVLSETYKQSTLTDEDSREIDPDNLYLSRAPRIRLPSELIRDQVLSISGLLNKEVGGPSVKPYQPEGIWEETTGGGGGSTSFYVQGKGQDLYRKSLYTFWKRTVPPPSMLTFDSSSRDLCTVKRQETNTPLQALVLLNDPQIIEAARVIAYNEMNTSSRLSEQISNVFLLATSRIPSVDELNSLTELHSEMLLQIEKGEIEPFEYLAIGEFVVKAENDVLVKLAALALTTHAILNLDESINRG